VGADVPECEEVGGLIGLLLSERRPGSGRFFFACARANFGASNLTRRLYMSTIIKLR
jgi:hypothetical protein